MAYRYGNDLSVQQSQTSYFNLSKLWNKNMILIQDTNGIVIVLRCIGIAASLTMKYWMSSVLLKESSKTIAQITQGRLQSSGVRFLQPGQNLLQFGHTGRTGIIRHTTAGIFVSGIPDIKEKIVDIPAGAKRLNCLFTLFMTRIPPAFTCNIHI